MHQILDILTSRSPLLPATHPQCYLHNVSGLRNSLWYTLYYTVNFMALPFEHVELKAHPAIVTMTRPLFQPCLYHFTDGEAEAQRSKTISFTSNNLSQCENGVLKPVSLAPGSTMPSLFSRWLPRREMGDTERGNAVSRVTGPSRSFRQQESKWVHLY